MIERAGRAWLATSVVAGLAACGASGDEAATETPGGVVNAGKGGKAGAAGAAGKAGASGGGGAGAGAASGGAGGASGAVGGGTSGTGAGAGAGAEACGNGVDDDGDGEVDEGCPCKPGEVASCYPGKPFELGPASPCKPGMHVCVDKGGEFAAEWGPCTGAKLPQIEACNGIDDDCDGAVDDGATCQCKPGEITACGSDVGACEKGQTTCDAGGKQGPCVGAVAPKPEICNGVDDDCNGTVDDGAGCECKPGEIIACGTDEGVCEKGQATCDAAGKLGPCVGGVAPQAEVCNGVDDDCDGQVDEEGGPAGGACECVPGTTEPCGLADGECKPGMKVCQAGGSYSACVGATLPKPESCNGKDDDCNGAVDDGLQCECLDGAVVECGSSSVGACKKGVIGCSGGKLGPCMGAVEPVAEVCGDGVDNDCDGQVDEGCVVEVQLNINGDCVCSPACPPEAPFPVGCNIVMSGGDSRGCVAIAGNKVYFQEGDACGAGKVTGTLLCSSQQGAGLNAQNCPINKSKPTYASKPSKCTAISSGSPGGCYF